MTLITPLKKKMNLNKHAMIMKRIINICLLSIVCFVMAISCNVQEMENGKNHGSGLNEGGIRLSSRVNDDALPSRAHMSDALGIVWDEGDRILWRYYHKADPEKDGYYSTEYELLDTDIENGGNEAIFRANLDDAELFGVFRYGYSGEQEMFFMETAKTVENVYTFTQAEAGVMNKDILHLHSGTACIDVDNSGGGDAQTVAMEIAGTVLRLLPYTSTYNTESVQSVSIFGGGEYIAGVVKYHYGDATYDYINTGWYPVKKIVANLGTPFSLTGVTSKTESKGIYISLPPTPSGLPIKKYTVAVTTDAAEYFFDYTAPLAVENNKVKNLYLNLDKATVRAASGSTTGVYWFDGNLAGSYGGTTLDFDHEEQTKQDQYWLAYTNVSGAVDARYPASYGDFYSKTRITVKDASGNTPSWLTCSWKPGSEVVAVHVDENTSADARTATITFSYPAHVYTYDLRSTEKSKVITVTQTGVAVVEASISSPSATTAPATGVTTITATLDIDINGTPATPAQYDAYVNEVTLTATNASVTRSGSTLTILVGANPTNAERVARVTATTADATNYLDITQSAGTTNKELVFSYDCDGDWQNGQKGLIQLNFNNTEDLSREDWLSLVTSLKKNGVAYASDVPASDKEALIKYAFQLTDEQYTELTSWITLDVEGGAGEVKFLLKGKTANTTGSLRSFEMYLYRSDLSAPKTRVYIRQDP